jgi:uncharacterized repeat protein (TIGR03803 family)
MRLEKLLTRLLPGVVAAAITLFFVPRAKAQSESTLYSFTGASDGGNPLSSLVMDAAGNLYGTTFVGGAYGAGEVYELTPVSDGWKETVLYNFTGGLDGADPYYADVIFDGAGNLYGTTVQGGTFNQGTVFKLTPTGNGWSESVLYSFAGGKDGAWPYAGLIFSPAGNLYGTTSIGGVYSSGTVFELTPGADGQWTESVIHTFNGKDGVSPLGGLVFDKAGRLYGVTQGGGAHNAGAVFQLGVSSSGQWTEKILHSFTGGADGSDPYAERLVFDSSGNLYGTTNGGGAFMRGAVFSLAENAAGFWSERILYSFEGNVAANPASGLILDGKGNLYGTCSNGNGETSVGAVFELSPSATGKWAERNLLLFTRTDGEFPNAALLRNSAGNLYGTTLLGGVSNMGVVFEVTP